MIDDLRSTYPYAYIQYSSHTVCSLQCYGAILHLPLASSRAQTAWWAAVRGGAASGVVGGSVSCRSTSEPPRARGWYVLPRRALRRARESVRHIRKCGGNQKSVKRCTKSISLAHFTYSTSSRSPTKLPIPKTLMFLFYLHVQDYELHIL